jgi:AAA domain
MRSDLEMHIAIGWPYRGRRVEQGEVLHIACEGVAGLAARKEAWRLHYVKGKDAEAIGQIDAASFHLCKDTALDLIKDVDQVIADIVTQFAERPIRIITIDTLNRSLGGSESNDKDMAAYLRAAVRLAEIFQCVVIVIHHCGHIENRPRGHSSLIGNVDAIIEVKKDNGGRTCTEVEDMRDGPKGATTRSRLAVIEVTRDDNGDPITSCVIIPDDDTPAEQIDQRGKAKADPTLKLSAKNRIAFDLLQKAITAHGKPAPGHNHIPPSASVVDTDLWRRFYLAGTSADGQPENTRRAALRRARKALQSKKLIGLCDEMVWIR